MWWPFQWLVIYVLGGLTFVPLVIVLTIVYVYKYGSVPIGDDDPDKITKAELQEKAERDEQISKTKAATAGPTKPLSGWLTIRRQFKPTTSSAGLFTPNSPTSPITPGASSSTEGDQPISAKSREKGDDTASSISTETTGSTAPPSSTTSTAPTTYSARIAQTYRSMVEARTRKEPPPKEYFFAVLKGPVLFLYEDEEQSECVAALTIDKFLVGVEGKEGKRFKGKDAEMFAKRNAIVLRRVVENGEGAKKGMGVLVKGMAGEEQAGEKEMEGRPWFIFSKSNTKMEDWFIALLQASSQSPTTSEVFSQSDMQTLVDTVDTEPDPIPMRWLNAMLGRIFFGLYRTEALEQFIITKIMKKLVRVPRPNFLGPIVVREVNVGTSPPFFSKPMLKDLSADGTAAFEVHMQYRSRPSQPDSEVRITIATTATIPTGFKPYVVNLVLAVVLKSIEGNMVVQIKKPPSNRIWYGFTQMPKMEVEIVPIVSERKIQIGMVLKAMEKQLREVIAESIVLPNMDDIAFFDTSKLNIRGGIFSEATKLKRDVGEKADSTTTTTGLSTETTETPIAAREIVGSAEDPSSATPLTSSTNGTMRKRPTKSKTTDINGLDLSAGEGSDPGPSLARTETAPVGSAAAASSGLAGGATTKKAVALQATKKWFAQAGAAKPPSLTAQVVTGPNTVSHDDNATRRSRSSERNAVPPVLVSTIGPASNEVNASNTPEISAVHVSASTPTLAEQSNGVRPIADLPLGPNDLPTFDSAGIKADANEKQKSSRSASISSANTTTTDWSGAPALDPSPLHASHASYGSQPPGQAAPNTQSAQSSHASLIASLRTRDKKALQSQVSTARDAMKTWGSNWAAKRKVGLGGRTSLDAREAEAEATRPTALYRPPEVDERGDDLNVGMVPTSPTSGRTLQERLNAAAHAPAAPAAAAGGSGTPPLPIPGPARERSSSTASRPSLFASPKSGSSAMSATSASPPKWAPVSSKATTELVRDEASASASASALATSTALQHGHGHNHGHGHGGRGRSSVDLNSAHVRPSSTSASGAGPRVSSQPAPGRSMVVPRVIKRPGEVTAIGHNAAPQPSMRTMSTEIGSQQATPPTDKEEKPTLPASISDDGLVKASSKAGADSPSPALTPTPASTSVPPPLPPRKTPDSSRSPSPSPKPPNTSVSTTTLPTPAPVPGSVLATVDPASPAQNVDGIKSPPLPGEPLDRAESAPNTATSSTGTPQPTKTTDAINFTDSITSSGPSNETEPKTTSTTSTSTSNPAKSTSPPKINKQLPDLSLSLPLSDDTGAASSSSPRTARDALREVVQRDEGARAKHTSSQAPDPAPAQGESQAQPTESEDRTHHLAAHDAQVEQDAVEAVEGGDRVDQGHTHGKDGEGDDAQESQDEGGLEGDALATADPTEHGRIPGHLIGA